MGNLHFTATIDAAKFNKTLDDIEKRIKGIQDNTSQGNPLLNFSNLNEGYAFVQTLGDIASGIVKVRGEFQQLETTFRALLKSKAAANELMQEVIKMAAETPFELRDIADGAKQLIIFGANAQTAVKDLKMLGDIAVGTATPVNELAAAYGALRQKGEAADDDLQKLASKGIPVYAELAKILNTNTENVKYFAEAGKVGFNEIQQAFTNMTTKGGMFDGLMEQQSKTLQGSLTQLSNAFSNMFNGIVQDQEGFLTSAVSAATDLVNNYETVIDVLKVLVITYGAYKAAVMTAAVVQGLLNSAETIGAWLSLAKSIRSAADAQALFNLVSKANPYALLASALVGLIAYLVIFNDEMSDAEKAQQKLNEITQKTEKELTGEIARIQVLTTTIKDETLSRETRNKALKELIAISPKHLSALNLENTATAQGTLAINGYIEAKRRQLELKNLEKELDESLQRELDARNNKNEPSFVEKSLYILHFGVEKGKKLIKATTEELNKEIIKSERISQKEIEKKISLITKEADEAQKTQNQHSKSSQKTIEDYNKEIQLQESLRDNNSKSRKETLQYEREINRLKRERAALTGENDIKEPFGSLAYWQTIAKNAGDFLSKINPLSPKNTKAIEKAQQQRLEAEFRIADLKLALEKDYADGSIESYEKIASNAASLLTKVNPEDTRFKELIKVQLEAQQKAENLRKTLAVKTVDEEIAEKKKQYELYNLWVKHVGEDAANAHFAALKNSDKSFRDYLQTNINSIQGRIDTRSASDADLENLVKYKSAIESINESIDAYKSKITATGQGLGSLTEYLKYLNEEQAKSDSKDEAKKGFLVEQMLETEKKRKALLNDFFNEFNLQEQKRIEIQGKYNDLRTQLDVQYADKKSAIYQQALAKINVQETEALQKYDVDTLLKNSAGYAELQKVITGTEDHVLKTRIESTKKVLEDLKDLKNTEEYKKQLQSLIDLQEKLINNHISYFSKIGGILGKFSKDANGFVGVLGELGAGISEAASNSSKLLEIGKIISATDKAVRNAQTTEEAIAAGAAGARKTQMAGLTMVADMAVQAINDIADTLKNRKAKEKAYYEMLINQQMTYNKLLNDEKRLKSQSGSLFSSDTSSVINDSLLARADALKNYNASLGSLLESGKAKDGTQTGINVKKALTTFLYNPAKAVFGTTETRDKLTPILEKYPDLYDKAIGGVKGFNKALAQSLIASNAVDEATKQQLQTTLDWVNQYELAQKQLQESIISMTGQIGEDLKNALVSAFKEGRSAAEAFGDTVNKVIENIIMQAIYAQMLKPVIDKLGKEIGESYATDENGVLIGDGSILDDVQRFREYGLKAALDSTKAMEDARKEFEKSGIDIFGKSDAGGGGGLSGSIRSITEETAGVLEGQMNAIRMTQATSLEVNRSQLLALTTIANNSEYLKHLELLKSIDKKLSTGVDLRSGGVNV